MVTPNQQKLSDAAASALIGTTDPKTGILFLKEPIGKASTPTSKSQHGQLDDGVFTWIEKTIGGCIFDVSGLTVGNMALRYNLAGVEKTIATNNAAIVCTASATNRIYADAAGVIQKNTSAFPADVFQLAIVTTGISDITTIEDVRLTNFQVGVVNALENATVGAAVDWSNQPLDNLGRLTLAPATELTIATGSITPTLTKHTVDTEADAASDDLTTIVAVADAVLILEAANTARTVVVKASGGNLDMPDGDFSLDDDLKQIMFWCDGTNWKEISRSRNTMAVLTANLDAAGFDVTDIGLQNLGTPESVTIASGIVAVTESLVEILNEAAAGTDDLNTATGGTEGDELHLQAADGAQTVVIKHAASGADTFFMGTGLDYSMDTREKRISFQHDGSRWVEVARGFRESDDLVGTGFNVPYSIHFHDEGALSIAVSKKTFQVPADVSLIIKDAYGEVDTAPSGGACIVDIRINGSSIFASQAEMINIADGTKTDTSTTKDAAAVGGDIISVEIEAVNTAADLSVTINAFAKLVTDPL